LEAIADPKRERFWYVSDAVSFEPSPLSVLLHSLLKRTPKSSGVEMAFWGYCAIQKETPLFFLETARGVLSLKQSDKKLLTWGRGIRFG
jgi:hypothetical protein